MAKISPTQNSIKKIKTDGWTTVAIVEYFVPFAKVRRDLFGFIDVLAVKDGDTLGIQCTTFNNRLARVRKIEDSEHLPVLREANWSLEVWGWRKNKSNKWEVDIIDVS